MDAHKNLAYSTVATAPSPAASGTSLVVGSGHGTRFPATPFNATIWPSNTIPDPSNSEIVRVTTVSTDTLTITRAQEGTSARTVIVGDQIAATITAKTLTDIEDALSNETSARAAKDDTLSQAVSVISQQVSVLSAAHSVLSQSVSVLSAVGNLISLQNNDTSVLSAGQPVYFHTSATTMKRAVLGGSPAIGFVYDGSVAVSVFGRVQIAGKVTLTTGQWDAVTGGSGGLVAGTTYFLTSAAGTMSTAAPAGGPFSQVGIAMSPTELLVGFSDTDTNMTSAFNVLSQAVSVISQQVSVHSQQISVLSQTVSGISALLSTLRGGTTGQVLKKSANADYNWSWAADATGGASSAGVTSNAISVLSQAVSVLSQGVSVVSNKLSNEISNRTSADNAVSAQAASALSQAISVGTATADSISNALSNEISNRQSADNSLSNAISLLSVTGHLLSLQNVDASAVSAGAPVYAFTSAFTFKRANVSVAAGKHCIGVVRDSSIAVSAFGLIQTGGYLSLTTGQWDNITGGAGGLSIGSPYFLDSTAGLLTATAPAAGTRPIGIAIATTTLQLMLADLNAATGGATSGTVTSNALSVLSQAVSVLSQGVSVVSNALSNETSNRQSADNVLSDKISVISQQVSVLSQGLSVVSQAVSVVSTAASNALSVANAASNAASVVSNALSNETSNRISADNVLSDKISVISQQVSVLSQAVSVLSQGISVVSTAASNALSVANAASNAASVVSNALSNETSNRQSVDNVLSDKISVISQQVSVLSQTVSSMSQLWSTLRGGTTGQVLKKSANPDYAWTWAADNTGGSSSATVTSNALSILSQAVSVLSQGVSVVSTAASNALSVANAVSNRVSALGLLSLQNNDASALSAGQPVYLFTSAYTMKRADNDAGGAAQRVVGLVQDGSVAVSAIGVVKTTGVLTLTTGQWDAVTGGSGGLTAGSKYYLGSTAGSLTTTLPTAAGATAVAVGTALNTTDMMLGVKDVLDWLSNAISVGTTTANDISNNLSNEISNRTSADNVLSLRMQSILSVDISVISQQVSALSQAHSALSQAVSVLSQAVSVISAGLGLPQLRVVSGATQTISATSMTNITGLSISCAAGGYYEVQGIIVHAHSAAVATAIYGMGCTFPALVAGATPAGGIAFESRTSVVQTSATAGVGGIQYAYLALSDAASGSVMLSAAAGASAVAYLTRFWGMFPISAAGTIQMQAKASATIAAIHILKGSFIRAFRII